MNRIVYHFPGAFHPFKFVCVFLEVSRIVLCVCHIQVVFILLWFVRIVMLDFCSFWKVVYKFTSNNLFIYVARFCVQISV